MGRNKKDVVLDKKTREELTTAIYQDIENNIKPELCREVVDSIKEEINNEYKNTLKEQITEDLVSDIKENIKKDQNKMVRRKNYKIFRLSFYILVLIALCLYLTYLLYQNGGLEIFNKYKIVENEKEPTTTMVVKDFAWYKEKYSYLLDNVVVTNYELLKGNYILANVDITDRLAMSYKTLTESDIAVESVIYTVDGEVLKNAYIKLFGSEVGFKHVNFSIDGLTYIYSQNSNKYLAISSNGPVENGRIVNSIVDIKENGNEIVITAVVALAKDGNIYNIFNVGEVVSEDTTVIDTVSDKLSKVDYHFEKKNNNFYIKAVNKK